jgi:hypothetical protein
MQNLLMADHLLGNNEFILTRSLTNPEKMSNLTTNSEHQNIPVTPVTSTVQ